jgi:hypothetical protein
VESAGGAARQMLGAAGQLARHADELRSKVKDFLNAVQAA